MSHCALIGMRHEPLRVLEVRVVPNAGKKREFSVDPFSELDPHFFLDVEVFLAPNHLHRSVEPGQLRFEVVLVPRKVGVVVGESVRRRHRALVLPRAMSSLNSRETSNWSSLGKPLLKAFARRLLLASGLLDLSHATKPATSAPSRALPRRRALCTNWKNPR